MLSYRAPPPEHAAPFLRGLRPPWRPFRVFRPLWISRNARGRINPDRVSAFYLMEKVVGNMFTPNPLWNTHKHTHTQTRAWNVRT